MKPKIFFSIILLVILASACSPASETISTPFPTMYVTLTPKPTSTPTPTPTPTIAPTKTPLPVDSSIMLSEFATITLRNKSTNLTLVITYTDVKYDMIGGYYAYEATVASTIDGEGKKVMPNVFVSTKLEQLEPLYRGVEVEAAFGSLFIHHSYEWEEVGE